MAEPITDFEAEVAEDNLTRNITVEPEVVEEPVPDDRSLLERFTDFRAGPGSNISQQAANRLALPPIIRQTAMALPWAEGMLFNKADDIYGAAQAAGQKLAGSEEEFVDLMDAGREDYEAATGSLVDPIFTEGEQSLFNLGGAFTGAPMAIGKGAARLIGTDNIFKAALTGATTGGLDAYLFGLNEEGDLAQQTAAGAALGTLLGPLGILAPAAIGALTGTNTAKKIQELLTRMGADKSIEAGDITKADKYLDVGDGVSAPERAKQAVTQMDVTTNTKEALEGVQRTALDEIGTAKTQLDDAISNIAKQEGPWGDTIMSVVRKEEDVAKQFSSARQNYEAAIEPRKHVKLSELDNRRVANALNRAFSPKVDTSLTGMPKQARDKAQEFVEEMYADARAFANQTGLPNPQPTIENLVQMQDRVKTYLSVEGAKNMGEGYAYMTTFKKRLDNVIDKVMADQGVKDFSQYRKAYTEAYDTQGAFELGRNMMTQTKYSAEDLAAYIANNPKTAEDIKQGFAAQLSRKLDKDPYKALTTFVGKPDARKADNVAKLRLVLGNDSADELIELADTVGPRKDALEKLNKEIQRHLDARVGTSPAPRFDVPVATGAFNSGASLSGAQAGAWRRLLSNPIAEELGPAGSERLARTLGMQGPEFQRAARNIRMQAALPNNLVTQGGVGAGAYAGNDDAAVTMDNLMDAPRAVENFLFGD